jgi:hypothetical protein
VYFSVNLNLSIKLINGAFVGECVNCVAIEMSQLASPQFAPRKKASSISVSVF